MKRVLQPASDAKKPTFKKMQQRFGLLLLLFFLAFGVASLYLLLNSPA